ncbi:MAG: protein phosphatase 2C domain-containing protein, partial [Eubacteriales bacterium]|nr:protein phosphatase 2C domain-containing protein [Eubacteriales bacterium]
MSNSELVDFFSNPDYLEEIVHDDTIAIEDERPGIYAAYQILGTRQSQQDCVSAVKRDGMLLAVVCDGMGGLSGGERASNAAVSRLLMDFEKADLSDPTGFLFQEAIQIDREVYELEDGEQRRLEAGTTMVAILIKDHQLHYVSVGDSRLYLMRGQEMVQVTEDQNYGMTLRRSLRNGEIDEAEYRKEVQYAEALISYIGMGGLKVIGCSSDAPIQIIEGDRLLLCSDGLYKSLSQE